MTYNFTTQQPLNIPRPTLIWHQTILYCLLWWSHIHSYKFKQLWGGNTCDTMANSRGHGHVSDKSAF